MPRISKPAYFWEGVGAWVGEDTDCFYLKINLWKLLALDSDAGELRGSIMKFNKFRKRRMKKFRFRRESNPAIPSRY